jgi:hypothetical protein
LTHSDKLDQDFIFVGNNDRRSVKSKHPIFFRPNLSVQRAPILTPPLAHRKQNIPALFSCGREQLLSVFGSCSLSRSTSSCSASSNACNKKQFHSLKLSGQKAGALEQSFASRLRMTCKHLSAANCGGVFA